jgi:uncharacterized protein (TIGR02271 family)
MTDETIVAVYDTATRADAAIRDLEAAGIPSGAITREPSAAGSMSGGPGRPVREQGFWSSMFGSEPDHGTAAYDRSVASGSHVVTVRAPEARVAHVIDILERHSPVDIDDHTTDPGFGGTGRTTTTTDQTRGMTEAGAVPGRGMRTHEGEEAIPLAEERINVSKRLVNRGTTRIRRFAVETPVEENVTLRSERVSVERRPVSGDAQVADADFADKTIEVTESDEEAVVGKTARVREEVVVRKDVADRVETVRDTVRREDVEITNDGNRDNSPARGAVAPGGR